MTKLPGPEAPKAPPAGAPPLPPANRSRTAHGLTRAAAEGRFALQRCPACARFTYPPRDACPKCLCPALEFVDAPEGGLLVSSTTIHASVDPYFREHLPWRQGLVTADCGPPIIVHLHRDCVEGERVRLSLQLDKAGQPVVFARPATETPNMQDDPAWQEMTADPRSRRILITDGRHPAAPALARALLQAGAASVHVGLPDPDEAFDGGALLRATDNVTPVALDLTDARSVAALAAAIGAEVDILINTADHVRPVHLFETDAPRCLMETMDATVAATAHLAQAFGPAMMARGAAGPNSAVAWVNILSAYALGAHPEFGLVSVAHAACLSLSHWLRAELRPGGIRVLNAFTGPVEGEWYQRAPPPKTSPSQLSRAVVDGLRRGLEDIYIGDIARDIQARLAANPKALERENGQ